MGASSEASVLPRKERGGVLPGTCPELAEGEELPADLGGQEAALLHWNQVYDTIRPHQALGYKTPDQFYQDWLIAHSTGKEVLSDMS